MKDLVLVAAVGLACIADAPVGFASEEEDRHRKKTAHHLDLSLPPLHPDGELVASASNTPPKATAQASSVGADTVPPADTPDLEDGVDENETVRDVEPHVEEDSALALDDMGDVGGDFEE